MPSTPLPATQGSWIKFGRFVAWAPPWAIDTAAIVVAILAALAVHHFAFRALTRRSEKQGLFMRALLQRTEGLTRFALVIAVVWAVAGAIAIPDTPGSLVQRLLQISLIVLVGWGALSTLHVAMVVYSRQFKLDSEDNLIARRHITQIKILERTAAVFIVLLTAGAALMTLPAVRQYGVSLLASAGAAGIIAGLALQPLLTNLIAGVQIALTQPIRIDDAVIVQDEWGWIEEIGATYVTVRLWDWRRMILPLSYFITQPFQNWTRQNASLIGTAMIYVDYTAPIEAMRTKLAEILKAAKQWDGNVVSLQVTDLSEKTMQVRCLASARNAGDTFDLRCVVREQMIAFLKAEHPHVLPQGRFALPEGAEQFAPQMGNGQANGSGRPAPATN